MRLMDEKDVIVMIDGVGDYTYKIFQREDCKCYAVVVYETDDESVDVARTKNQSNWAKAKADALSVIEKHRMIRHSK